MIGDIIKKEILDNLFSHKFLFIFILCSVLILFSVYIGASDYVESKKEYDLNIAALNERMQPPATYSLFSERLGYRLYRPPQVLRTVVAGVEDAAGRASYPNVPYETNLSESRQESNTVFTLFGSLDLMFAVKFILSLCALFLTYDAVSGEKESGTLKLTLSNSVSRARLISGKIIGNYLSILMLFLAPLLMGLIVLSVFPGISLNGGDWLRLVFIIVMFLLYISTFFALGIFVSAMTTRASTSFLILLFLWMALVIVIPGASVILAEQFRPIASSSALANEKGLYGTLASQDVNQEFNKRYSEEIMPKMNQRRMELEPLAKQDPQKYQEEIAKLSVAANEEVSKLSVIMQQEVNDRVTAHNEEVNRDYQLQKDAQQSLAKNLSRISPASGLTFSSMTLARTGADEYDRFLAATRNYRPIHRAWMNNNPDFTEIDPATGLSKARNIDPSIIPQIPYTPERLGELLMRTLPDFALMAAMMIILLTGSYFAFLRYDVR